MIPIHWTSRPQIKNLHDLLDCHRRYGGSIIEYDEVMSALVFTTRATRYRWVRPGGSRIAKGFLQSVLTLILGWWSVTGFFWTLYALVKNFRGGLDVTRLLTAPVTLEGPAVDETALRAMDAEAKGHRRAFIIVLLVLAAVITVLCNLPSKQGR